MNNLFGKKESPAIDGKGNNGKIKQQTIKNIFGSSVEVNEITNNYTLRHNNNIEIQKAKDELIDRLSENHIKRFYAMINDQPRLLNSKETIATSKKNLYKLFTKIADINLSTEQQNKLIDIRAYPKIPTSLKL